MPPPGSATPRPWTKRIAVLAGAIGLIALLRATVLAPDPVAVRLTPVERGLVEATVTNSKAGTIRARLRSKVTAEIGGRVAEILQREGAHVIKGAPLVLLNDTSLRAQLRLSEQGVVVAAAQKREACLRKERAGRELARSQQLSAQRIVSDDVLDQLEYARDAAAVACNAASAELERARASVDATLAEVEKTVITAPFDGVVAEVAAEIGEWVTPSPPLLTSPAVIDLIDPTSLYVSAPMDEVDSGKVHPGLPVKITVDSRPGDKFPGTVVRVAPYVLDIEAQNRTVEIEVEFDDPDVALTMLPGTSADVEVILESHADVPRIPTSALLEGSRVLILADDVLEERPVSLGLRNWEYVELLNGVAVGERVVTSLDRIEIKAGARATPTEEEPAT